MTEPRNRVVQVRRFGDPDGLEVVDAPLPTAGRDEVRVRVLASGMEYTDVVIRRHLYPQTMHRQPPFVLGYDVVGEIDQLGDGVRGFQVGDRVADLTVLGSTSSMAGVSLQSRRTSGTRAEPLSPWIALANAAEMSLT
jgi:NADPH:quinone reductase